MYKSLRTNLFPNKWMRLNNVRHWKSLRETIKSFVHAELNKFVYDTSRAIWVSSRYKNMIYATVFPPEFFQLVTFVTDVAHIIIIIMN